MGMKRCSTCEQVKPFSDFHRNRSTQDGYAVLCKVCQTAAKRRSRVGDRAEAHAIFGSACQRCGNDDWRVLELDHINGGGNADRVAGKLSRHYGRAYIEHVKAHRAEFQLLCANCHRIKTWEDRDRARGTPMPEPQTREERRAATSANQSAKIKRYWDSLTAEERSERSRRAAATVRANGGQRHNRAKSK